MNVFIRPATLADIRQMAELAGPAVTAQGLADWMDDGSAYAAWHLVEDEYGRLLGFQHIGPGSGGPPQACEIATFLGPRPLPSGAGTRLFETTAEAARHLRYRRISARIAVANDAARIYYQSNGFRPLEQTPTHLKMYFDFD